MAKSTPVAKKEAPAEEVVAAEDVFTPGLPEALVSPTGDSLNPAFAAPSE